MNEEVCGTLMDSNDRIDDLVSLETIYVGQHQAQVAYQILRQARDEHPENPALASAVHALFICLRATDEALDEEWDAIGGRATTEDAPKIKMVVTA